MVNRFLSTFGAVAIFALLISFGARDVTPASPVRTPAKAIAEIPITHHFSVRAPQVGGIQGGAPPPLAATLPLEGGVAISQITMFGGYAPGGSIGDAPVIVRVDGAERWKIRMSPASQYVPASATIVPPLIAPPGSLLEVGIESGSGAYADLTITGYTLPAEYFGGP